MRKPEQDQFYKLMGDCIRKRMNLKDLSIYETARRGKIQYNTVQSIMSGCPFRAHHFIWIQRVLGVSPSVLISEIQKQIKEGAIHGKEEKESSEETVQESNEETVEGFI